MRKMAIV